MLRYIFFAIHPAYQRMPHMYNMCYDTYSCFQHTNTDGPPAIGSQIYSSASGPIVRYKILSPSCAFCCDTRVCVLMYVFVCNSQLQHACVCSYISGMWLKLQLGWSSRHCQQMDMGHWDSRILLQPKMGNSLTLNLVDDTGDYLSKFYCLMYTLYEC